MTEQESGMHIGGTACVTWGVCFVTQAKGGCALKIASPYDFF